MPFAGLKKRRDRVLPILIHNMESSRFAVVIRIQFWQTLGNHFKSLRPLIACMIYDRLGLTSKCQDQKPMGRARLLNPGTITASQTDILHSKQPCPVPPAMSQAMHPSLRPEAELIERIHQASHATQRHAQQCLMTWKTS